VIEAAARPTLRPDRTHGQRPGLRPARHALKDFLGEVIEIIKTQSNATEVLVERVNPLRFAEQNGKEKYDGFFQQFNDAMMAPH
jgi:uncharacterized oxidoreductase